MRSNEILELSGVTYGVVSEIKMICDMIAERTRGHSNKLNATIEVDTNLESCTHDVPIYVENGGFHVWESKHSIKTEYNLKISHLLIIQFK